MTDQDKERLGKIMAYGKDSVNWPVQRAKYERDEEEEEYVEPDRFEECKNCILIINRLY